jgi:hypothetical protein
LPSLTANRQSGVLIGSRLARIVIVPETPDIHNGGESSRTEDTGELVAAKYKLYIQALKCEILRTTLEKEKRRGGASFFIDNRSVIRVQIQFLTIEGQQTLLI